VRAGLDHALVAVRRERCRRRVLPVVAPIAELVKERFDEALERGWSDRDWTAIAELSE
jgi:hypothetical protein